MEDKHLTKLPITFTDFVDRIIQRSDLVAVFPDAIDNAAGSDFWIGSVSKLHKIRGDVQKLEVVWYEEGVTQQWKPMQLNRLHSTSTIGVATVLISGFVLDQNGCISPGILSMIEEASHIRQVSQQPDYVSEGDISADG